jgi:hypothetical protein
MMTKRFAIAISFAVLLAACGGVDGLSADAQASSGGTTTTLTNPLPSSPPSPDMVIRESFGPGPDYVRPAGGKGTLKSVGAGTSLGGFWVEYPGSKDMSWISPDGTWRFAGCSDDPYELPSPLQPFNGCVGSWWFDGVVAFPDALIPFGGLPGTY